MLRLLIAISAVVAAASLLAACSALDDADWNGGGNGQRSGAGGSDSGDGGGQAIERDEAVGVEWTATWMWGGDIVADAPPTLLLQTDNRLGGFAGVNRFFGRYTLNAQKGRLKMEGFGSTLMAGPEPNMAQETTYMKLLERVTRARINRHDELELLEKNDVLIRFERSSDAIRHGLIGAEWSLFRLRGEKPIQGHEASIEFKNDGSFAGFAGVNRFFGKYTKDDRTGRIELRDIGSTKMAGDERIMRQEQRLLASLGAADRFSFTEDGDLLLHNGDNIAARFRKAKK